MPLGGQRLKQREQRRVEQPFGEQGSYDQVFAFPKAEWLSNSSQQCPAAYLLHCVLSEPVAALFSSSVVFCSLTEAPAVASSESLLRSMTTISISGSKHGDR